MAIKGYQSNFIDSKIKKLSVVLPTLNAGQKKDKVKGKFDYTHFSIVLSKQRKFPYFTATNIDGKRFIRVKRADVFDSGRDEWREDKRAESFQWGQKLYDAPKSYFDRGHMTKREDPQWGINYEAARKAAQETFFFTNCVPQLSDLNQKIWQSLETYILTKQTVESKLKICLFTGPVLSVNDPEFVTKIKGQSIQIPVLFWKVIYYTVDGKSLSKVAFIMGQEDLLLSRGIATPKIGIRTLDAFFTPATNFFMDYEDAETYQVSMKTIQTLTGLKFPPAKEPYKDSRPIKLIKKVVQATGKKKLFNAAINLDLEMPEFNLTNIKL